MTPARLLVDVRTPDEFRAGHLPGAVNIPLRDFARRYGGLGQYRDRELVLYCETGARAGYAGRYLHSRGFTELRFLEGHMQAWRRAGLPQER